MTAWKPNPETQRFTSLEDNSQEKSQDKIERDIARLKKTFESSPINFLILIENLLSDFNNVPISEFVKLIKPKSYIFAESLERLRLVGRSLDLWIELAPFANEDMIAMIIKQLSQDEINRIQYATKLRLDNPSYEGKESIIRMILLDTNLRKYYFKNIKLVEKDIELWVKVITKSSQKELIISELRKNILQELEYGIPRSTFPTSLIELCDGVSIEFITNHKGISELVS
jgi:hypothetical protein